MGSPRLFHPSSPNSRAMEGQAHEKPRLKSEPRLLYIFLDAPLSSYFMQFFPILSQSITQLLRMKKRGSAQSLTHPAFTFIHFQLVHAFQGHPQPGGFYFAELAKRPAVNHMPHFPGAAHTTKHVWQHCENTRNIKKSSSNKHEPCKPRAFEVKGFLEVCAAHTA